MSKRLDEMDRTELYERIRKAERERDEARKERDFFQSVAIESQGWDWLSAEESTLNDGSYDIDQMQSLHDQARDDVSTSLIKLRAKHWREAADHLEGKVVIGPHLIRKKADAIERGES